LKPSFANKRRLSLANSAVVEVFAPTYEARETKTHEQQPNTP
jgi:hypothetical protein